jgi:hypothetical protein
MAGKPAKNAREIKTERNNLSKRTSVIGIRIEAGFCNAIGLQ